jgi:hypothetical protein
VEVILSPRNGVFSLFFGVLYVDALPENGGINNRSGDFFAEHLSTDVPVI